MCLYKDILLVCVRLQSYGKYQTAKLLFVLLSKESFNFPPVVLRGLSIFPNSWRVREKGERGVYFRVCVRASSPRLLHYRLLSPLIPPGRKNAETKIALIYEDVNYGKSGVSHTSLHSPTLKCVWGWVGGGGVEEG